VLCIVEFCTCLADDLDHNDINIEFLFLAYDDITFMHIIFSV
jgi:hypothetical protein